MSKTENAPVVRTSKPKTAAQLAKKQRNIDAYNARCEAIRQACLQTNAEREAKAAAQAAAVARQAYESSYVNLALSGPSKTILNKWLAGRPATFERVERFFKQSTNLTPPNVTLIESKAA